MNSFAERIFRADAEPRGRYSPLSVGRAAQIVVRLAKPTCQGTEVKTTEYFKYVRKRPDRATIQDEWITRVIQFPQRSEIQSDGRIRKWGWIKEEDKFLRVILLEDGETVHNAFFDRSFREKRQ